MGWKLLSSSTDKVFSGVAQAIYIRELFYGDG
jgi:hypothetical protein